MFDIFNRIRRYRNRKKWRKLNTHNETTITGEYDPSMISVGRATYGGINFLCFDNKTKLKIGNYCSISPNVMFIVSADHNMNTISTYPFKVKVTHECKYEGLSKGDIVIDDDVWIGYGAIILSGVHIGQGAVIAAGAVVTKDVSPYAIVAGVPAKVLKYRFNDNQIEQLLKLEYSKLSENMIRDHISELYEIYNGNKIPDWMST